MIWVIILLLAVIALLGIAIGLIWNVGEAINVAHVWQRQHIDELRADVSDLKRRL